MIARARDPGAGEPAAARPASGGADANGRGCGSGLSSLRELLRAEGGLMAALLRAGEPVAGSREGPADAAQPPSPARVAAAGPRARSDPQEYELLIEAIFEGYLLHYGKPRILDVPEADVGLLAGDRLYAIGLARLVDLGDTFAVGELADTITLSALAHGAGEPELAEVVWSAGARAVGWGRSEAHERAKSLLLAGAPQAFEAMRTIAADGRAGSIAPRYC